MIDIHSHILYGIDDGAKTIDESLKILNNAEKNGINAIFFTPHYIADSKYITPDNLKNDILNKIKKEYTGKINLYIGNEIYMNDKIYDFINKKEISPLGISKYLLIELPIFNEYPNLEKQLFYLRDKGYKIIIAHPERYFYFKNDFKKLLKLCEQGIYFQGNYMSLYNIYGKSTKKLFIKILKHNCYSFMASDIHSEYQNYYDKLKSSKKKITELTNKEYMESIFESNAAKIISGEEIIVNYKEKISFFDRIRGF